MNQTGHRRTGTIIVWTMAVVAAMAVVFVAATAPEVSLGARSARPDLVLRLRAEHRGGKSVYVGVGGTIGGQTNPTLIVPVGKVVQLVLENGQTAVHDVAIPAFGQYSTSLKAKGEVAELTFRADRVGEFRYFCTVSSHRAAGMEGSLQVRGPVAGSDHTAHGTGTASTVGTVARAPDDLPPGELRRPPRTVSVDLVVQQVTARFDADRTYPFFTFNGQVPGPFLRVRVGDTVAVRLVNPPENDHVHSVDFHAVTGPGGGGAATQAEPGQERRFQFKATKTGLFVYHCATPLVAQHIANGMYGLILVEPEEGLPRVDRELYLTQQELYTDLPFTEHGAFQFDSTKLLAEEPEFFLFNGALGALGGIHPVVVQAGERVRIFFGNGGPNAGSSFHMVGEVIDKAYPGGSLFAPQRDLQTLFVPPGSSGIAEFVFEVPGSYMLMDHALSREARGAVGHIEVTGVPRPDLFLAQETQP